MPKDNFGNNYSVNGSGQNSQGTLLRYASQSVVVFGDGTHTLTIRAGNNYTSRSYESGSNSNTYNCKFHHSFATAIFRLYGCERPLSLVEICKQTATMTARTTTRTRTVPITTTRATGTRAIPSRMAAVGRIRAVMASRPSGMFLLSST